MCVILLLLIIIIINDMCNIINEMIIDINDINVYVY